MERNDGVVVSPPTELEDTRPTEPHSDAAPRISAPFSHFAPRLARAKLAGGAKIAAAARGKEDE